MFLFFKQKTAYEMRISDWSSDVCSSDLSRAASSKSRRLRGCQAQAHRAKNSSNRIRVKIPETMSVPAWCVLAEALEIGDHGVEFGLAGHVRRRGGDLLVGVGHAQSLQPRHQRAAPPRSAARREGQACDSQCQSR